MFIYICLYAHHLLLLANNENENEEMNLIELTDSNFVNIRLSIDDKSMSNVIN